jgi:hypothetical protein
MIQDAIAIVGNTEEMEVMDASIESSNVCSAHCSEIYALTTSRLLGLSPTKRVQPHVRNTRQIILVFFIHLPACCGTIVMPIRPHVYGGVQWHRVARLARSMA